MTTVSIFGNGAMGSAIGDLLSAGGATIHHVSRDDETLTGDIVVLAVPYDAINDICARYRDQLAGRVVVDITNPLDFDTFDSLTVPAGSSAAAELQRAIPHARIVKAFNTNFAATLAAKSLAAKSLGTDAASVPVTVLVAGDDDAAKQTLIDAVNAAGLSAVDAGGLNRAHELEAIGFLQLTLANANALDWTGGFALVR